jgi:pimeloyl-ACP methyl ester carboxylesterase
MATRTRRSPRKATAGPAAAAAAAAARPRGRGINALLEMRSTLEVAALMVGLPLLTRAPRGDGHPVLLLPGFGATDSSMEVLRLFLKSRNYAVEAWGMGRNTGFHRKFSNVVEQKVRYLHHKHGERVSLVGWSLGGVFAFYAGHVAPECVRTVISLGSPLRIDPDRRPPPGVSAMYRVLAHPMGPIAHAARSRSKAMRAPPPVPSTCVYSEHDGVVPPEQATLAGDPADHENVRVPGSHLGLGFNSLVMWIVADRLAQPEGRWRPFEPTGAMAKLFKVAGSQPASV